MRGEKRQKHLSNKQINRMLPFTTAPLFHALNIMATGDAARFHMPGHKGEPLFQSYAEIFALDYTETYGTGNLYLGEGPIRDAEIAAARYWKSQDAFFLTGGSSQGILAMLATAVGAGGSVLVDRECHKSVCHACALLDITPYFIMPEIIETFDISGSLLAEKAEQILKEHTEIKAVLLTSPTYYGVCRDIPAFAALCKTYEVQLLVDAAHGAHFPAVSKKSAITEGADMAVISAHKTLPCLGQGAVVLLGENANRKLLRENTALFGTSSPSYPIMASIDLARAYMEDPGKKAYRKAAHECNILRQYITFKTKFRALTPENFPDLDPCRLTVCTAGTDMTGYELADALWENFGVACELADAKNVVFIITCADNNASLHRLRRGISKLSRKIAATEKESSADTVSFPEIIRTQSVRSAWFSDYAKVSLEMAEGKICARPLTPYPPGVPLIWPGEKITKAHVEFLKQKCYNDIDEIDIVLR